MSGGQRGCGQVSALSLAESVMRDAERLSKDEPAE
jgi:hypothetical protein